MIQYKLHVDHDNGFYHKYEYLFMIIYHSVYPDSPLITSIPFI